MNKPTDQYLPRTKKVVAKKHWKNVSFILLVISFVWMVLTVLVPLMRDTGLNKYTGLQKQIAEGILDLTHLYNIPHSPTILPDFAYKVSIDDIHPVTPQEVEKYCKDEDPAYITTDPANPRFYTAIVTEQYLFALPNTIYYVGCDPIDYIHVQVFGIPKEIDTRIPM